MKTLVIVAHPNLAESRINKRWVAELTKVPNVTVHNLYDVYPDENIDVEREQQLLLDHDRIVLQFPMYWYSSPSLLKKWQDVVLAYGFAYGSTGNKLNGKQIMIVTSSGGPAEAYQAGGYNNYTVSELYRPFQQMANLIGARFLPTYALQGVLNVTDEQLEQSARDVAAYVVREF